MKEKSQKKNSSDAYKSGNIIEYQIQHHRQLAIKIVTNALYGVSSSLHKSTYRPLLASMTTYLARLHLVRLNLHSKDYNKQKITKNIHTIDNSNENNLDSSRIYSDKAIQQPILYGDTDSIFLRATLDDSTKILKSFSEYPIHNNCLKVELEKTAVKALFLAKKSYILECFDEAGFKEEEAGFQKTFLYTKQIFTNMKSQPTKQFLNEIIHFIFKQVLIKSQKIETIICNTHVAKPNNIVNDIYSKQDLSEIFQRFNQVDENVFTNNFRMSQDLSEYKSNTQQIIQLKHLSKIENVSFLKGTSIESKHYDFIFKEGQHYGKIDYNNPAQIMFLNNSKNKSSTLMITLLEDYYSHLFKKYSIGVSKKRIFELDTNAILSKLFKCLEGLNKKFELDCNEIKNQIFKIKHADYLEDNSIEKDLIKNQIDMYLNKEDFFDKPKKIKKIKN